MIILIILIFVVLLIIILILASIIIIILSYHIISYHIISYRIVSYHIISYHIISRHPHSSNRNWKSVLTKSQRKNRKLYLNPFSKDRRDLKFGGNGVIFRGESGGDAQKAVAPRKHANWHRIAPNCFDFAISCKICSNKMFFDVEK